MPNVYKPGLIQIRARYTNEFDGDKTENVTWWQGAFTSPLTQAQLANIQAVFDVQWPLMWRIPGATGAQYIGSIATDWSSASGTDNDTTTSLSPVNGQATGLAAAQACMLLSLQIPLRFKGGHGRVYLPWLGQSALADQKSVTASVVSNVSAEFVALRTNMNAISSGNGGPFSWCVYKFRNDAVKADPILITGGVIQADLATQRRRLRKAPHH